MHILQSEQRNKAKKMIENKGPCQVGKQGEIFVGEKGTKGKFARKHISPMGYSLVLYIELKILVFAP